MGMANPLPAEEPANAVARPELIRARGRPARGINDVDRRQLARYGVAAGLLLVVALAAILIAHSLRSDDPAATDVAKRELRVNTLKPGEQAFRMVPVFRRSAIDYFRATRGLLVLTNRRLLYLGLRPHELFAPSDAPPTFEETDFPLDSMIRMRSRPSFLGLGRAVSIRSSAASLRVNVPSSGWPTAALLQVALDVRRERAEAMGVRLRELAKRAEEERTSAAAEARKAQYYTVQRGDALGSIATRWNVTPDSLRSWNHLPNNKIRVGQVLLVKPQITNR